MKITIKRKTDSPKIDTPVPVLEPVRAKVLTALQNQIDYLSTNQLVDIESQIYNKALAFGKKKAIECNFSNRLFTKVYQGDARHILLNLDNNSYLKNSELKDQILKGNIQTSNIINLEPQDLMPSRWENYSKMIEAEINEIAHGKKECTTRIYKCGKCKQNYTKYYDRQQRSADEGTTVFITCLTCGNEWTINN